MEIALYLVLLLVGLAAALAASDLAVSYTRALAAGLGAPPFVVGVVLVAVGTDLPEIANSIASHVQDEGDVNVGDSVGSTLTQYTFVLGLFPLVIAVIAVSLVAVGIGATVAVRSLVELSEEVGVPEFVLAFFGASLGTSAPEIVV